MPRLPDSGRGRQSLEGSRGELEFHGPHVEAVAHRAFEESLDVEAVRDPSDGHGEAIAEIVASARLHDVGEPDRVGQPGSQLLDRARPPDPGLGLAAGQHGEGILGVRAGVAEGRRRRGEGDDLVVGDAAIRVEDVRRPLRSLRRGEEDRRVLGVEPLGGLGDALPVAGEDDRHVQHHRRDRDEQAGDGELPLGLAQAAARQDPCRRGHAHHPMSARKPDRRAVRPSSSAA